MARRDPADFAEFVAARSPALHRAAYLMVGERQLAQDLLQEALTKTYVAWPRLRDPQQGRGLHPQGHHHDRHLVVPPQVLAGRTPDRDAPRGRGRRARRRGDAARVALGGPPGAATPPTRGHRAALLRGPHRGPDCRGHGLRRRHGEEPGLGGPDQAPGAARRPLRRPGPGSSPRDADEGDPMTELLKDMMNDRADSLGAPDLDVLGMVREGNRRVQRRRTACPRCRCRCRRGCGHRRTPHADGRP